MQTGLALGSLELRATTRGKGKRLRGRFPYNKPAVLSDGGKKGRPKKEVIASRAFAYRVERPEEEIHLLVGHDFGQPLASRGAGTLDLEDSDDALTFEAFIAPSVQRTSWWQDFEGAHEAGLVRGISPGFRIPPARVAPQAEKVEEEDPRLGMAMIRTIFEALLFELSVVTSAAYAEAMIEALEDEPEEEAPEERSAAGLILPSDPAAGLRRTLMRWRR